MAIVQGWGAWDDFFVSCEPRGSGRNFQPMALPPPPTLSEFLGIYLFNWEKAMKAKDVQADTHLLYLMKHLVHTCVEQEAEIEKLKRRKP